MAIKPTQTQFTAPSGVVYTLQHPGARAKARIIDASTGKTGNFSLEKLNEQMFQHVIVEPKVNWAYFDENENGIQDYDALIEEATNFLMGPRA